MKIFLIIPFFVLTLVSCQTTGDPNAGGYFGWSQEKAQVRQDVLQDSLNLEESKTPGLQSKRDNLLASRDSLRRQIAATKQRVAKTKTRVAKAKTPAARKAATVANKAATADLSKLNRELVLLESSI